VKIIIPAQQTLVQIMDALILQFLVVLPALLIHNVKIIIPAQKMYALIMDALILN
jgi:hypothetical protein